MCLLQSTSMSRAQLPAYDKQVRHWRISKDVLGTGTTSTVLRATHVNLPTLCAAVKVISRSRLLAKAQADPTALHLVDSVIRHEALLMKVSQHERIVRLYDFISNDDLVYIVMEHAPHKTLYDLFHASPSYLPRLLVTHIFLQLIQGLAYMHALHVVHRDLKLENIFVFGPDVKSLLRGDPSAYADLNIKIGDFGLAHVDDPGRLSTVFHGSPHYQAPEVWSHIPHRSLPTDIWSAGVLLYALLTRRLPFDVASLENVKVPHHDRVYRDQRDIRGYLRDEPYMPFDVPRVIHPAADHLLRKIFAYDPAARPTAREILCDFFFDELPKPCDKSGEGRASAVAMDPRVELYDLATLCVPPGRHVPRKTFVGSGLELAVKDRLSSSDGGRMEKQWAQRLSFYETAKDVWEASVEAQIAEKRRHKYTRSLGRRSSTAEILVCREMNLPVPRPKFTGSLSFCNLRFMVTQKESHDVSAARPVLAAYTPLPTSASVAFALQDRREALLRRAYELGFGTADLREFADEASKIVRVAQQGNKRMRLQDIAQEVEKGRTAHDSAASERVTGDGSVCGSIATLVVGDGNGIPTIKLSGLY